MKFRIIFPLLCILICIAVQGKNLLQKLDRQVFYAAIKSVKLIDIDNELSVLSSAQVIEKDAFEGALLMRKAGLVSLPAEKLKLFKAGRIKLETVLAKDSSNAEYRFLRLIIQEHAPKIVKYSKQLASDKLFVQKSFKSLSPIVQQAITDYSRSSKILHPQDL